MISMNHESIAVDTQIDFEKTAKNPWTVYLTEGKYFFNNQYRQAESVLFKLRKKEYEELEIYDIWYNPWTNQYNIRKSESNPFETDKYCDEGFLIGSFVINGCKLSVMYPPGTDECVKYIRPFTKEFDEGYEKRRIMEDDCNGLCKAFSFDFDSSYNITPQDCENVSRPDPDYCKTSVGTDLGTLFKLPNELKSFCTVAKGESTNMLDCTDSVGGDDGSEFDPDEALLPKCPVGGP